MRGLNKVMLIGHLGADPEVKYLDSGVAVANFSLATSETYKDKNGNRVDQTEWHNVVLWRKLAETAEKFLKKGSFIYLEGKIRTRSWEDKDGNKKYMTEVVADTFNMLDKKGDSTEYTSTESQAKEAENVVSDNTEDDLPF